MLRGLIIRQALLIVDMALALMIVGVAYVVIGRVFEADVKGVSPVLAISGNNQTAPSLNTQKERSVYEGIVQSELFGPAAKSAKAAGDLPPTQEPSVVVTALPLKLYGTAAAYPTDPLGAAIIENTTSRTVDAYYINQTVMDNVVLQEIHPREVALLNRTTNTLEMLPASEPEGVAQPAGSGPPGVGGRPPRLGSKAGGTSASSYTGASSSSTKSQNQISLKRNDLVKEMSQLNPAELYSQLSPQLKKNDKGEVVGITAQNIGSIPLAQKFGFRDGDVLQMINGVAIDSEQRVAEVINRFQNAPTHWVSILRDGKPQTLVFKVE